MRQKLLLCSILCSMDHASYNIAIIIQQDATEYSLFKSVNCSTCFRWYFTHLQYLALMRLVLLPFTTGSSTGLNNARYCRWVKYHAKHVEQLTDLNKLYSVASCCKIIATNTTVLHKRWLHLSTEPVFTDSFSPFHCRYKPQVYCREK